MLENVKQYIETSKSFLGVLKDAVILIVAILLFGFPTFLSKRLNDSGITKAHLGIVEWENQAVKTKEDYAKLAKETDDLKTQLTTTKHKFDSIVKTIKDTIAKKSIESLTTEINSSITQVTTTSSALKNGLFKQQTFVEENILGNDNNGGWIFLGKVSEDKKQWLQANTILANENKMPYMLEGKSVKIVDDVYLRQGNEGVASNYTNLPIQKVIKQGQIVTINKIGYTHAINGGNFIWAYCNN